VPVSNTSGKTARRFGSATAVRDIEIPVYAAGSVCLRPHEAFAQAPLDERACAIALNAALLDSKLKMRMCLVAGCVASNCELDLQHSVNTICSDRLANHLAVRRAQILSHANTMTGRNAAAHLPLRLPSVKSHHIIQAYCP
jgi:hypothetical protein